MRQYPRFLSAENEPESIVKLQINRQDNLMVVATSDDNYKRRRRLSESENSKTLVVYMLNNWQKMNVNQSHRLSLWFYS